MAHSPPPVAPVETKVKAATTGAVLSALGIWALDEYVFTAASVPGPVEAAVVLVVTGAATFLPGWYARHTARTGSPR